VVCTISDLQKIQLGVGLKENSSLIQHKQFSLMQTQTEVSTSTTGSLLLLKSKIKPPY
jgi:hypothetical protein